MILVDSPHSFSLTMAQHSFHDLLQWHSIPYTAYYNGTALLTRLTMAQHSFHDLPWHSISGSEHYLLRLHSINGSEDAYLRWHSISRSEHACLLRLHSISSSEHACLFTLTQHRWEWKAWHSIGVFPMMSVRYKYSKILYSNTYKDQ